MLTARSLSCRRATARLPDDDTLVARRLSEMANGLYASPAYLNPRPPPDTGPDNGVH